MVLDKFNLAIPKPKPHYLFVYIRISYIYILQSSNACTYLRRIRIRITCVMCYYNTCLLSFILYTRFFLFFSFSISLDFHFIIIILAPILYTNQPTIQPTNHRHHLSSYVHHIYQIKHKGVNSN